MEIRIELNSKEMEFLRQLRKKPRANKWSGRREDDAFIKKYRDCIDSFKDAGMVEKKDNGSPGSYWEYGLNEKGLKLQEDILSPTKNRKL